MQRIKCRELLVSFNASYHQAVRLVPSDSPSAAWLEVEVSNGSLMIYHVRKDLSIERVVSYNYSHVLGITADYCTRIE